jgi:outer membrane protein assembly factor BamB
MNETITISPADRACDFVYQERVSRDRSLHVLMQDVSARADGERAGFLAAAYRDTIARYQSSAQLERALTFLRRAVRSLDDLSIQVDTRLDDFRGLGLYLLVEEADVFYLLYARDAPARIRVNGVFVPMHAMEARTHRQVLDIPIETTRDQHDLFAQTLPDSLGLFCIPRPRDGADLELLLGGSATDLAAALDALDGRSGSASALVSDRIARTVLCLRFRGRRTVGDADAKHALRSTTARTWVRGVAAAGMIAAVAVGVGWVASRVDFERASIDSGAPADESGHLAGRATQERLTPVMTRETSVAERGPEVVTASDSAPVESKGERFALAWERAYSEPVTSSPSLMGEGVVFGSRDGHVYAIDRDGGEKMWSYAAVGGVGASPVVRGEAVVVADYGGNVYRLSRADGRVGWKRQLREKVVSTPSSTGERIAVGTTRGNVYALSLETGRVLWKFATRGQVRGGITHANATFFVPSHDGRLYALADDTGRKRWSVALGGPVASTPFADDARVAVGTAKGNIVAHSLADGKRLWSFSTRGPVNSAVLIHNDRVYAGSSDERVYCLDANTGTLVWSFETSGTVLSRPFVDGDRVLVTSYDGSVYALDANNGELLDRYSTEQAIFSSPIVDGDRVYFGNNGGRFFCLNLRDS